MRGFYFLPITCAMVNPDTPPPSRNPPPKLQPSVPGEALNTGRGLFREILQHIINSIIFNNHWKAEKKTTHHGGEYGAAVLPAPKVTPGWWAPWGGFGWGGVPQPCSSWRHSRHGAPEGNGYRQPAGYPVHRALSPGRVRGTPHPGRVAGALSLGKVPPPWHSPLSLRKVPAPLHAGDGPQRTLGKVLAVLHSGKVPGARCPVPKEGPHYPTPEKVPGARCLASCRELCALCPVPGDNPNVLHPREGPWGMMCDVPQGTRCTVPCPWGQSLMTCIPGEGPWDTVPAIPRGTRCTVSYPWGQSSMSCILGKVPGTRCLTSRGVPYAPCPVPGDNPRCLWDMVPAIPQGARCTAPTAPRPPGMPPACRSPAPREGPRGRSR